MKTRTPCAGVIADFGNCGIQKVLGSNEGTTKQVAPGLITRETTLVAGREFSKVSNLFGFVSFQ